MSNKHNSKRTLRWKVTVWLNKLTVRLKTCKQILTGKKKHWVLLSIPDEHFNNLILEKQFEVEISYHGLQMYNVNTIIVAMYNSKSDVDRLLDRAKFQADVIDFEGLDENLDL